MAALHYGNTNRPVSLELSYCDRLEEPFCELDAWLVEKSSHDTRKPQCERQQDNLWNDRVQL